MLEHSRRCHRGRDRVFRPRERGPGTQQPALSSLTGFLLEAVPKCLTGTLLTDYRDAKRQEREQEIANWRAILADPDSDDEFKQTALDELGRLSG